MEQHKKCPACGEVLAPGTARCPSCRLEGLDQIFLSRADYDNWVSKVLKPHMGRISRRVFSAYDTLLILTGAGELYGMGQNSSGQIGENEDYLLFEPVHMASNVISAAVSSEYTVFVTEDGRIHIRGRGEFAERVPEFTDVREVFLFGSEFYVVNRQGQIFVFGHNDNGSLQAAQEECLMTFPEETYSPSNVFYDAYHDYGDRYETCDHHPDPWDRLSAEKSVRWWIRETKEYQAFASLYDEENLHIKLELTATDIYTASIGYYIRWHFIPTLVLRNTYLYTPVLYHNQDYANTPHRLYSLPLHPSYRHLFDPYPQVRKACVDCCWTKARSIAVCHDGTLVWFDNNENIHRLNWTKAPIHDLAVMRGFDRALVSCKGGRLYLLDTSKLPEIEITREITL